MAFSIRDICEQAEAISNGEHDVIEPGMPFSFHEGMLPGEGVWQGDFRICLSKDVWPADTSADSWEQVDFDSDAALQLVPGQTVGSRHCLDDSAGVTLFRPKGWGASYEGLLGPVLHVTEARTITHPTHGDVHLLPNESYDCHYARVWDEEQQRERRSID